jgi:hypothetical protein
MAGNCSMTSSTPRSWRFSITVATGRRVPRNARAPPTLSGTLSAVGHCDNQALPWLISFRLQAFGKLRRPSRGLTRRPRIPSAAATSRPRGSNWRTFGSPPNTFYPFTLVFQIPPSPKCLQNRSALTGDSGVESHRRSPPNSGAYSAASLRDRGVLRAPESIVQARFASPLLATADDVCILRFGMPRRGRHQSAKQTVDITLH